MTRTFFQARIDRPIGYKDSHGNTYPINYGYIPNLFAGDGEEQDVYIISKQVTGPLERFEGELVAIIHRTDDVEDKWILTSAGEKVTEQTILDCTQFIEQYFNSWIELL